MYASGQKGINHFTTLGGDYFIIFSRIQYSSSDLVIFKCGSNSSNCQKEGHPGIDPGCHQQCIYFLLFYHIHEVVYHRCSQDNGDPSCEVRQIQDYQGFLILIIALDSIYLNLYDDIANGSCKCIS